TTTGRTFLSSARYTSAWILSSPTVLNVYVCFGSGGSAIRAGLASSSAVPATTLKRAKGTRVAVIEDLPKMEPKPVPARTAVLSSSPSKVGSTTFATHSETLHAARDRGTRVGRDPCTCAARFAG